MAECGFGAIVAWVLEVGTGVAVLVTVAGDIGRVAWAVPTDAAAISATAMDTSI